MTPSFAEAPIMLSRTEYYCWAEAQPRGRYERVADEVVAMAPERIAQVRVKARAWQALDQAVRVPSIRHYLIVRADRRAMIQHQRCDGGDIRTRLMAEGRIALDPPGIEIAT